MPVELSESSSAAPQAVARNDEVVLRLAENPTTGYRWEVSSSGAGELALIADTFVAGAGIPGAGGQRVFRYVCRSPGNVQLEAIKRRPWEAGVVLETKVFSIVVG